jgi:hypothetical protein
MVRRVISRDKDLLLVHQLGQGAVTNPDHNKQQNCDLNDTN